MTTPKTCGNCRHFERWITLNYQAYGFGRCSHKKPMIVTKICQPTVDSEADRCECYQPTPLAASIGRNEPVKEAQS